MKSGVIKLFIILLLSSLVFINNVVIAAVPTESSGGSVSLGLGDLEKYAGDGGSSQAFDTKINKVIFVIQVVASIISVAVLMVLGIKYMMGSVEAKAEYKKTMIPYLVGAILVFGITNITGFLYYLGKNMI